MTERYSRNFEEWEFLQSETATQKGIKNEFEKKEHKISLINLVVKFLQPLRDKLGKPIKITSGYRCQQLNEAVGGALSSFHCLGMAVDITVDGMTAKELFEYIVSQVRNGSLPLPREIILEPSWVHISFVGNSKQCYYYEIGGVKRILYHKRILSQKENVLQAYKEAKKKTIEKTFKELLAIPIERMGREDKQDLIILERLIRELREENQWKVCI